MSTNVTLAERLIEIRTKRKMTQAKLAKEIGISRVALGNYESGRRKPDSFVITRICEKLNVSADYLLGLTNTENQAYAKIAETTGLDETAIEFLRRATLSYRQLINWLLREEHIEYVQEIQPQYPEDDYLDDEKAYQEHLNHLEWEKKNSEISILEHVNNDWTFADYYSNLTSEEIETQMKKDHEELFHSGEQFDHSSVPTYEKCLAQENRFKAYWEHEIAEKEKSNLLSVILEYINYKNSCRLDTMNRSEQLTEEHSIYIEIGNGKSVQFPSKESEELFEFMLIQKVIEALKKFKSNIGHK